MAVSLDVAPGPFQQRVHKALRCWDDRRPNEGLLDDLLIAQRLAGDRPLAQRLSTNLVLQQGLEQLAALSPADAELLDLRFCTYMNMEEACRHINYSQSSIYSKQNQAIARLAAILHRLEMAAWQERLVALEGQLEAPPVRLIGVETQLDHLSALLAEEGAPWLLSIEGIGGIGKTALAAALLRKMAQTTCYAGFAWVSAQVVDLDLCGDVHPRSHPAITSAAILTSLVHRLLPEVHPALVDTGEALKALRLHLQKSAHLVVIDSFELVLDPQVLLPLLHSLARPSRFILTSRRRLIAEPNVYLHCVPELSESDALLLIRHLACAHNLAALRHCDNRELATLYATVGGNPLALMLVADQLHVRPLRAVLADLAHLRTAPLETLFDYILRGAWMGLSERERRVLRALPAAELRRLDGEEIGDLCGLPASETTVVLQHLVRAGLVECLGDLSGCHYRLHNLTRTYLRQFARRHAAPAQQ